MTAHIIVSKADGILTLVMNRPEKKNALTDAMYGVLADEIEGAQTDSATRVVVIRGEGDMFTAGNDLADFAAAKPDEGARNVGRFIHALARATKPLIAAVQGRAVGVGTTMLLHCDYVVLAEDAKLTTPFVNLALVPEAASSLLLPARIGHLRAFSMLALGEAVEAHQAVEWGLANIVVPLGELVPAIEAVAARIARQPLGAIQATKRLMRDAEQLTGQMAVEGKEFTARLQSPEAKEAFMAFAQRREPDFTQFN
jgi:enoyl-CoA hydratase/carnithine racemase